MSEIYKCRISRVDTSKAALHPIIVEFQNGSLRPESAKKLQCGVYEHKSTKRRCIAVVDGSTSYTGQEDQDEYCQTFIAIRNRKSNEVGLFTASRALLAPMIMRDATSSIKTANIKEDLLDLARSFGSKRDRRRAEQYDKMQMSVDATKDNLEAAARQVVVKEEELSAPLDGFLAGLPHCNRAAKSVDALYNLADIVSEADIAELEPEARRVLLAGEEELTSSNYKYSSLYQLLFRHILGLQGEEIQVQSMAVLTYIEYIVSLIKMPAHYFNKSELVVCPNSASINQKLIETFTNEGPLCRLRPLDMKDKAICYVLVLSLLLHNYKVPFDKLLTTVGSNSSEMTMLCKAVGATVQTSKELKHATFSLPLPAPVQSLRLTGRRSGKKR